MSRLPIYLGPRSTLNPLSMAFVIQQLAQVIRAQKVVCITSVMVASRSNPSQASPQLPHVLFGYACCTLQATLVAARSRIDVR